MKNKHFDNDPVIDTLLKNSIQAAGELRKEQGFWARFISFLERRSEMKHELKRAKMAEQLHEARMARCREGKHDIQNWTEGQKTSIYRVGANPKNSLPTHYQKSWVGYCAHCGVPEVVKKNV